VPIINDQGQKQGKEFCTKECTITNDGGMTIEFAAAYGIPELKRLERHYKFDLNNGSLAIKDTFTLSKPVPVVERFISVFKPEIKDDGVLIKAGDLTVELKCSKKVAPEIKEVVYRNFSCQDITVYTINFMFNDGDKNIQTEFFVK